MRQHNFINCPISTLLDIFKYFQTNKLYYKNQCQDMIKNTYFNNFEEIQS